MFQTPLYHKDDHIFYDFMHTPLQIYEGSNPSIDNPPYIVSRNFIIFLFEWVETMSGKEIGNWESIEIQS